LERPDGAKTDALVSFLSVKSRNGAPRLTVGSPTWRSGGFRVRLGVRGRPQLSSFSPPRKRPGPRQTSALLLGLVRNPSPWQQSFSATLCALSPEIAQTAELAKHFRCMMQQHDASAWLTWLKATSQSPLHHFVVHLQRDAAAVQAALTLPWSTGPVEGHIHRLKLIKRQMYRRAILDLLRIRVLYPA